MATFRELRDKLNSLSDKQLDQEIKIIAKGYGVNAPLDVSFEYGEMETKLEFCIADFDLWCDPDPYYGGVPDIPYDDVDFGGDEEDEGIILLGVDEGMPYFSLHDEDSCGNGGFIIN